MICNYSALPPLPKASHLPKLQAEDSKFKGSSQSMHSVLARNAWAARCCQQRTSSEGAARHRMSRRFSSTAAENMQ